MKCLLLSRYSRLGASSRVRSYQYLPYLEAHGINVSVAPLLGDTYIRNLYAGRPADWATVVASYYRRIRHLFESWRFDLVWIEYELLPWLPAWGEFLLAFLRIPYVVDYDDAAVKAVMKIYQSEHVKSFLEIRNHCTSLIYLINFIIYKSFADAINSATSRTFVFPSLLKLMHLQFV